MRIAQLVAPHRFSVTEAPPPEPAPGEVQVQVHMCGICGSDLHNFSEGSVGDSPSVFPMVLGHEPTGTVLKTGPGVTGLQKGDRAFLEPAIFCYHCDMCLAGRHNLCYNMRFLSAGTEPGYFRDIVTVPAHCLVPMPKGVGFAEGTLFEPLAVALHSLGFTERKPGHTAAVIGCGPIGLLTIAALRLNGARRIYAADPVPHRREMAKALGADMVVDGELARQVLNDTSQRGVDAVFDCVTHGDSLEQACLAVARAGRVVATGIPSERRPPVHMHELRRKEAGLFSVRRSNHETSEAVELLREYPKLLGPVVTHVMEIGSIEAAFAKLERYEDGVGKVVVAVADAAA